jgi:hypothetical protein
MAILVRPLNCVFRTLDWHALRANARVNRIRNGRNHRSRVWERVPIHAFLKANVITQLILNAPQIQFVSA